ncbi:MAG: hypothetical protein CL940_07035 [Deltaproteobacteria bacterium]|nr:hypothetical protein [Deltaproteobacteria bacterium]
MSQSIPLAGGGGSPPRGPSDGSLRSVLAHLNDDERSGIVETQDGDNNTTRLHLRRGTIVSVEQTSNADSWLLAEYMLRTKSISTRALLKARKRALKNDQALEEVLIERKLLSEDLLKRLMALEAEETLMPLFRVEGLEVKFLEERPIPALFGSPLPLSYVLKEAERQAKRWPALRRKVGRPDAIYRLDGAFSTSAMGFEPADEEDELEIELSGDARLVYFFVNGRRTTEQIARCCALSLFQTMNAMDELLQAYLVALVTTHGPGEKIRERSSFFPRLVWTVTSLAMIAALAVLGEGVSALAKQEAAIVIPAELKSAARMSHLRDTQESIRLFELSRGRFPHQLTELTEAGFLDEPSLATGASIRYLADENGFRLEDEGVKR